MARIAFETFAVEVPSGWANITETVEGDDPPYTLAHRDGSGALQFSVALYQSGPVPEPSPTILRQMVEEFGQKKGLGEPSQIVSELGPPRLAAGSFAWGEDFLRIWQISDGRSFAFVTYTSEADVVESELVACEQIVRSIVFGHGLGGSAEQGAAADRGNR